MNPDQFSVTKELIETVQKSVDLLSKDREYDLTKIQEIKDEMPEIRIRLGAVEGQLDEIRKSIKDMPKQTQNQVAEAIEPARQESAQLKEVIIDKKIVAIDTQKAKSQKKSVWQKLKNWFKKGWE